MKLLFRFSLSILFIRIFLNACSAIGSINPVRPTPTPASSNTSAACPVNKPAWVLAPEDSAVLNPPAYGYYFVNEDSSIWASAWWWGKEEYPLHAGRDGNKVGWFRPEGAVMEITGRRLDGQAPPLEADIPCCYPTRFQASGLYFPTWGCWEVTAKAADSVLLFIVNVEP